MAYKNFFATKLYTEIGASDTTITLETAPTATSGRLVLEARNPTQREIIKYTGVSGNQITGVTRGEGGTSAKSHTKNALVEMNLTAEDIQDLYDAFASFASTNGSGWYSLPVTPTVIANDGQKQHKVRFANADYRALLQEGTKLKVPRTGTTPTTSFGFVSASSQYASKTSPTGITFTDDFTVEAWVYLDSYSGGNSTVLSRWSGTNGWGFRISGAGAISLFGNGGASDDVASYQAVPTGKWTHIAASLDMSASTGAIYIDGVSVPLTSYNNGANTALIQAGNLQIGALNNAELFSGKIANVRLWSTIRTAAQIRDNMNQETPASTTGLVGHWKGNGSWNDSSTNANHLTAVNSAVNNSATHPYSATEYAIITKVEYTASNTDVTVFTGNGCIPNETLGATSYSTARAPYGFPAGKNKWAVEYRTFLNDAFTSGSGVWHATLNNAYLLLPIGEWNMSHTSTSYIYRAAGAPTTLSVGLAPTSIATDGTTVIPATVHGWWQNAPTENISTRTVQNIPYTATAPVNMYIAGYCPGSSGVSWNNTASARSSGIIRAECAYL